MKHLTLALGTLAVISLVIGDFFVSFGIYAVIIAVGTILLWRTT